MKFKRIILIMLIAICMSIAIHSAVGEPIQRIKTDETTIDHELENDEKRFAEPIIVPAPYTDEIIEDGEYGQIVGEDLPDDTPHILDVGNGNYDTEIAFGAEDKSKESNYAYNKQNLSAPSLIATGLVAMFFVGLIYLKRR